MAQWITKQGYDTFNLAEENVLDQKGAEIQLVKFRTGKYGHYHKRKTEFFYFLKGSGKAVINNREVTITPGTSLLVKPNDYHTFINENSEPLEAIMFKTNSQTDDTFTE